MSLDDLNASKLRYYNRIEQTKSVQIYKHVLDICKKRLKRHIKTHKQSTEYIFNVPRFILDKPTFDVPECTAFIIKKLENGGFHVKYMEDRGAIWICWSKYKHLDLSLIHI